MRLADIPSTVVGSSGSGSRLGSLYSSNAPVSTRRGRRRSESSFRIGALAARMWAGVVCASLPSRSIERSSVVSLRSSALDWYLYCGTRELPALGGGSLGTVVGVVARDDVGGGAASGSLEGLASRFFCSAARTSYIL